MTATDTLRVTFLWLLSAVLSGCLFIVFSNQANVILDDGFAQKTMKKVIEKSRR
jgi:hypothetical protein